MDLRHYYQSCHPERNFITGGASDKVESKDPYSPDALCVYDLSTALCFCSDAVLKATFP